MIKHITGYRDGGTVSIILSHTASLELRYETTEGLGKSPEFKAALRGCEEDYLFEICIDKRCHDNNPFIGRWTIGYPTKPYAYEITDLSIKQWIIEQVESFIKVQQYYLSEMKTLTEKYVQ